MLGAGAASSTAVLPLTAPASIQRMILSTSAWDKYGACEAFYYQKLFL